MQFKKLQKEYPAFIYEKYEWGIVKGNLNISFDFKIEPGIQFNPKVVIENIPQSRIKSLNKKVIDNLVFHLGLIELLSYWKATCSPKVEIKAGSLSKEQIKWWKDLVKNGMGQFFYENKINFQKPNFLKITSLRRSTLRESYPGRLENKILVPVGGGKDSVVTLELLKRTKKEFSSFSLNPTRAARNIMKIAGFKNPIIVRRKINEKLLELNRKGYLNGHTPFSAYLAFISVLVALIFDYKFIAFSNERSSNEGNVKYLGKIVNHQYSKSFDFEEKFRNYSKKYLAKNIEYFSFLRPLYEIQIARLFSQYPRYFPVFLSCNVAFQTNSGRKRPIGRWCGQCPKCLFVFVSLYPFVENRELIKVFSKNLFEDKKLLPLMLRLIGEKSFKPFECVGSKKESLIAFYLSWKKAKRAGERPYLLNYFEKEILPKYKNLERESKKIMGSWSDQHNLLRSLEKILKKNAIST